MKYVLTICSKDKDKSESPLPAIQRYKDKRIAHVFKISRRLSLPMVIFSGKYGLLKTNDLIPFYDLRLEKEHIDKMVEKLVYQFEQLNVSKIDFYGLDEHEHVGWKPYYETIEKVCERTGSELTIIHLDEGDYAAE